MSNLLNWFATANWPELLGVIAAWILAFDRLAKLTPSESDNKVVAFLYKVFAALGLKVPDVK